MYTRRQLRAQYAIGVSWFRYYEETLYGKLEETLPSHELSLTLEQRERWGSIEASIEWSQYLHDLSKSRLEAIGTDLAAPGARAVGGGGNQRLAHPRPAVDSGPRRHRRRGAAAPAPPRKRLRVQRLGSA